MNTKQIEELSQTEEYQELLEYLDESIIIAGLSLDIPLDEIQDKYYGSYSSDIEFAQEYADQCGYIEKQLSWPHNCIDWEQAARHLMQDFIEESGHYFLSY